MARGRPAEKKRHRSTLELTLPRQQARYLHTSYTRRPKCRSFEIAPIKPSRRWHPPFSSALPSLIFGDLFVARVRDIQVE
jgi:hypothetical protein